MRVFVEVKSISLRQSLEGTVAGHLVVLGQPHRALGDDVAVVLNSQHCIEETVNFFKVDFDEVGQWVILNTARERVFLLHFLLFFLRDLLSFDWVRNIILDLDQHLRWLSFEHARKLVI